jgi:AraC-like DNA-binding protein
MGLRIGWGDVSDAGTSSGGAAAASSSAPSFRFSTDALPERERVPMFREVFGRNILGIDVAEPLGEGPFRADVFVKQFAGLNILWANYSPLRGGRTRAQLADGNHGLAFQWSASPSAGEHMGRDIELGSNDGVLISCSDPGGSAFPSAAPMVSLAFPREALGPLLRDGEDCAGRPIPANAPAFALLRRYIDMLKQEEGIVTPELQQLAALHVYDLLAIAIGPQRDARHAAVRRGLRAAHLSAIKKEIANRAGGKLSIEIVAARHRLSPRHVQRLFEEDGTSFTEYLREQRLLRAHRMLVSPRFAHLRVSDIAFEAGFSDLSWFNRLFRRRFGIAPADIRTGHTNQT